MSHGRIYPSPLWRWRGSATQTRTARSGSTGKLSGYIFNLETDGLAPGSFNLSLVAGEDPTVHLVGFTVK
jgi:hypothetical protein